MKAPGTDKAGDGAEIPRERVIFSLPLDLVEPLRLLAAESKVASLREGSPEETMSGIVEKALRVELAKRDRQEKRGGKGKGR